MSQKTQTCPKGTKGRSPAPNKSGFSATDANLTFLPYRVHRDGHLAPTRYAERMASKRNPREMPEQIDDIPENIAAAVLGQPPKENWRYMEGHTERSQPSD